MSNERMLIPARQLAGNNKATFLTRVLSIAPPGMLC